LEAVEVPDQLRITWARGAEFLDAFDREGSGRYSVAVPGARNVLRTPALGQRLAIELEFLDSERRFRHHARIVGHDVGPPEIMTFEFRAEDRAVLELIVCGAEGKSIPYLHRRAERCPVWMPVEVLVGDLWRRAIITELSELGMFVTMPGPPRATTQVTVRIPTEEKLRLSVAARVVYTRGGEDGGFAGELVFTTRADEVRIRKALRSALQAMKR
jgi:hypothetical protein